MVFSGRLFFLCGVIKNSDYRGEVVSRAESKGKRGLVEREKEEKKKRRKYRESG